MTGNVAPTDLLGSPVGPRRRPLTPQTVLALQDYRAYPSVTLLLTTRPGPQLDPADAALLEKLLGEARDRLAADASTEASAVLRALDDLPTQLEGPVERAVALFISTAHTSRVDLSVDVVDRADIDPTFATRDLVRALHRTPRHVVLIPHRRRSTAARRLKRVPRPRQRRLPAPRPAAPAGRTGAPAVPAQRRRGTRRLSPAPPGTAGHRRSPANAVIVSVDIPQRPPARRHHSQRLSARTVR